MENQGTCSCLCYTKPNCANVIYAFLITTTIFETIWAADSFFEDYFVNATSCRKTSDDIMNENEEGKRLVGYILGLAGVPVIILSIVLLVLEDGARGKHFLVKLWFPVLAVYMLVSFVDFLYGILYLIDVKKKNPDSVYKPGFAKIIVATFLKGFKLLFYMIYMQFFCKTYCYHDSPHFLYAHLAQNSTVSDDVIIPAASVPQSNTVCRIVDFYSSGSGNDRDGDNTECGQPRYAIGRKDSKCGAADQQGIVTIHRFDGASLESFVSAEEPIALPPSARDQGIDTMIIRDVTAEEKEDNQDTNSLLLLG